jgi:hypothetical protein
MAVPQALAARVTGQLAAQPDARVYTNDPSGSFAGAEQLLALETVFAGQFR